MKAYWSEKPGIIYIDIPKTSVDENVTVIALLLDGKIALWSDQE
jgi:alpha-L-fucosidase